MGLGTDAFSAQDGAYQPYGSPGGMFGGMMASMLAGRPETPTFYAGNTGDFNRQLQAFRQERERRQFLDAVQHTGQSDIYRLGAGMASMTHGGLDPQQQAAWGQASSQLASLAGNLMGSRMFLEQMQVISPGFAYTAAAAPLLARMGNPSGRVAGMDESGAVAAARLQEQLFYAPGSAQARAGFSPLELADITANLYREGRMPMSTSQEALLRNQNVVDLVGSGVLTDADLEGTGLTRERIRDMQEASQDPARASELQQMRGAAQGDAVARRLQDEVKPLAALRDLLAERGQGGQAAKELFGIMDDLIKSSGGTTPGQKAQFIRGVTVALRDGGMTLQELKGLMIMSDKVAESMQLTRSGAAAGGATAGMQATRTLQSMGVGPLFGMDNADIGGMQAIQESLAATDSAAGASMATLLQMAQAGLIDTESAQGQAAIELLRGFDTRKQISDPTGLLEGGAEGLRGVTRLSQGEVEDMLADRAGRDRAIAANPDVVGALGGLYGQETTQLISESTAANLRLANPELDAESAARIARAGQDAKMSIPAQFIASSGDITGAANKIRLAAEAREAAALAAASPRDDALQATAMRLAEFERGLQEGAPEEARAAAAAYLASEQRAENRAIEMRDPALTTESHIARYGEQAQRRVGLQVQADTQNRAELDALMSGFQEPSVMAAMAEKLRKAGMNGQPLTVKGLAEVAAGLASERDPDGPTAALIRYVEDKSEIRTDIESQLASKTSQARDELARAGKRGRELDDAVEAKLNGDDGVANLRAQARSLDDTIAALESAFGMLATQTAPKDASSVAAAAAGAAESALSFNQVTINLNGQTLFNGSGTGSGTRASIGSAR